MRGASEVQKIYRGSNLVWERPGGSTLPNNLVLYLKLDEANGNAASAVGSNIFTAYNSPGSIGGKVGNARVYEKDFNRWHGLASPSGLAPGTSDFTFSCWFQYTGDFYYNSLLHWGNQSSSNPYMWFLLVNDSLQVQFVDGLSGNNTMLTGVSFSTATWHHLTCVFVRDGNLTTYKNGAAAATNDISGYQGAITPNSGIGLNCYYNDPSLALDGLLDEVKVWHRALSPAEVLEDYNNGAAGNPLPL